MRLDKLHEQWENINVIIFTPSILTESLLSRILNPKAMIKLQHILQHNTAIFSSDRETTSALKLFQQLMILMIEMCLISGLNKSSLTFQP